MNERTSPDKTGWFTGGDPEDLKRASASIAEGEADEPADWPALAVEAGYVESEEAYYEWLHEATIHAIPEKRFKSASGQTTSSSFMRSVLWTTEREYCYKRAHCKLRSTV